MLLRHKTLLVCDALRNILSCNKHIDVHVNTVYDRNILQTACLLLTLKLE